MGEWHIPSFEELSSLLWGQAPALHGLCKPHSALEQAFRDSFLSSKEWFWTSSIDSADERVKVIDFRDGFCGRASQNAKGLVRLVKVSGQESTWRCGDPAKLRYKEHTSSTVIDNKTGLIWTKNAIGNPVSYQDMLKLDVKSVLKRAA